eukprot:1957551-Karenia_brevis.AAC.1
MHTPGGGGARAGGRRGPSPPTPCSGGPSSLTLFGALNDVSEVLGVLEYAGGCLGGSCGILDRSLGE